MPRQILAITFLNYLLLSCILPLPSPDHCYEFTSNTPSDTCGGASFPRHSECIITSANGGSPYCEIGGCSFEISSFLYGTLSTGYGSTWTIGLWVWDYPNMHGTPFGIVQVRETMRIGHRGYQLCDWASIGRHLHQTGLHSHSHNWHGMGQLPMGLYLPLLWLSN